MSTALVALVLAFSPMNHSGRLVSASPSIGVESPDSSRQVSSLPPPVNPAPDPIPAAVPPATTVCQCRGVNRGVCECLKRGLTCHCTADHGHVFEVAAAPKPAPTKPADEAVPYYGSDGQWHWFENGTHWWLKGKPQEGQQYGDWRMTSGRMVRAMAVQIQPAKQSGHWEYRKVCHGSYCTMEPYRWVND